MSATNDGGPAFPVPPDGGFMDGDAGWRSLSSQEGMTLRDYFAAHADLHDLSQMIPEKLIELCAVLQIDVRDYKSQKHYMPFIVALRYKWADAMLTERAKNKEAKT